MILKNYNNIINEYNYLNILYNNSFNKLFYCNFKDIKDLYQYRSDIELKLFNINNNILKLNRLLKNLYSQLYQLLNNQLYYELLYNK